MNVLVTGGAGFIGSHLIDRLLEKNHKVTCIDNFTLGNIDNLQNALMSSEFELIEMDLLHKNELNTVFKKNSFEEVYHLAANSDIQKGIESTNRDLELTFQTTVNVLEAMRLNDVEKILFTSSSAVFGSHDNALTEDLTMKPESLYGAAKLSSEAYIRAFSTLYNIQSWIIRLSNTVGERLTHGILFDFLKKINTNRDELIVLGDGTQSKPYMYVHELIDSIFFVMNNSNSLINVFNVGPKDEVTVSEIASIFIENFGQNQKIKYTGGKIGWKGDISKYSQNSQKINQLGWEPKLTSKEAIIKTIQKIKQLN
jgi:UDP-glucose 4-epimerase